MAEFDDIREQLGMARNAHAQTVDQVAAAREKLAQIAERELELSRVFDPHNPKHLEERGRLNAEREQTQAELRRNLDKQVNDLNLETTLIADFGRFSDPREGIGRLRDDTPILLLPVRLETRFKTVASREGAPRQQLWVRIYPDDCWIDTFDPILTAEEVAAAKVYWAGIWRAGTFEDQQRAAWRMLAERHGSGRAMWIISQYQPTNSADKPNKTEPQDVVLTISTETPLTPAEVDAAAEYWRETWLADGDVTRITQALTALEAAVGSSERAAEIVSKYQPLNFDEPLPEGVERDAVSVSVSVLVFAPIETKRNAWARAPKLNILPDRFVFIGYQGDGPPVVQLSNAVQSPLFAGPDPSAPKEEQIRHDDSGALIVPDEMQWITNFDRAVDVGMGFRVPLTPAQADRGFDRVLVVGLRLRSNEETSKNELETLFRHHSFSRKGFALVQQGTPTNNTEAVGSGFARLDDPDETFNDAKAPLFTAQSNWLDKRDGQWLAEYLGLDSALFEHVHHAGASDQSCERAMNAALWPATLGYWMETMMSPVFTRDTVEQTREFFNRYVVASGAIPAIRIGSQPYGILPATAISRMRWFEETPLRNTLDPMLSYIRQLYPILLDIYSDWRGMSNNVEFVGNGGSDPHKTLLEIVGLHSGSVDWSQRYAENLSTVFNRLNIMGLGHLFRRILKDKWDAARSLLTRLGSKADPFILQKIFSGRHNELRGGVVDDKPLSETDPIRIWTADNSRNYIQWLIDAAKASLDALYQQNGFKDDKPPAALLYLLLRHALQLGYHDVSVRLHENAGLFDALAAARARIDEPIMHVGQAQQISESRYQPLYTAASAITGSPTQTVHQFITAALPTLNFASYLRNQLDGLERLKSQPTARLERAFADHVDCCSYRLDAWLQGIVNYQLTAMRNIRDGSDGNGRQGIHIGAYAWLEPLRSENKVLSQVELRDAELRAEFNKPEDPPLMRDSTNEGYVHAPSLNHAVAAAVLRNGFISNASPENRQTMAVNLTSERVRTALGLLEGIRAGQGLADLLGYQFERGLHDRHNVAEVDQFIFKLRKAFPLRADRMRETKTEEGMPIQNIEARNVIDGLALAEHIKRTGNKTYPFGKSGLPSTTNPAQDEAINAETDRLIESHDAVADLALSEGVYQAVLGNYDRVASTYDAYARGNFPPEPDVVRTPLNGIGLTHRVSLHLQAGVDPTVSPILGLLMTPRAQAEPSLNAWLASVLPPLANVGCILNFREAATGTAAIREVTLRDLNLQPADLIALIKDDRQQGMSELDDRILKHAVQNFGPRPDQPVTIQYMAKQLATYSIFEFMPLVRHVRRLVTTSRALKATDMSLVNEAKSDQDRASIIDKNRLDLVRTAMQNLRTDLVAFRTQLEGPLSDLPARRGEILTNVDNYVTNGVALLARAATFVVPQAGWGFVYDFKKRVFSAILAQAASLVTRWNEKLAEFQDLLNEEAALPGTASALRRFELLTRAERLISTTPTDPLPVTPAAFRTDLITGTRPAFEARRDAFVALQNTTRTLVTDLLADVAALLPLTAFDSEAYSLIDHEASVISFAQDTLSIVGVNISELDRRLAASQALFDEHDTAASAAGRVVALEKASKALLGEDFVIFAEFELQVDQGDELEKAFDASRSRTLFTHLTTPPDPALLPPDDFPVDTWLYGVARIREKMRDWEQTMMFSGALGRPELSLDAMQLPFTADDRWLGLEFPDDLKLDHDRLLYTAHFATNTFVKTARQCGMLLDEWTETIPGSDVDTGIAVHHDRPDTEAPQAMLLVTPSQFRGTWQWDDLVNALNETFDFAKQRAVEPADIDKTAYAPFLPAAVMASQVSQLTIALELSLNNRVEGVLRRT